MQSGYLGIQNVHASAEYAYKKSVLGWSKKYFMDNGQPKFVHSIHSDDGSVTVVLPQFVRIDPKSV